MPVPTSHQARPTLPRKKKVFLRTEVPRIEKIISIGIVCLLGGIGGAVWYAGRHFDPGLYSLRVDALKSTESAVEGKAATLRGDGGGEPGEATERAKSSAGMGGNAAEVAKSSEASGEEG